MAKTVKSPEELAALAQGANVDVSEEVQDEQVEETQDDQVEETQDDQVEETQDDQVDGEEENTEVKHGGIDPVVYANLLAEKTVLEKELQSVKDELEQSSVDTKALQKVAVEAVNRLQVALHESPTDLSQVSASVVLNVYAEKEAKFNETFKVGSTSSAKVESKNENINGSGIFPIND